MEGVLRNIRLIVQFDGTDFYGWQMQADQRTVQGDLTEALSKLTGQSLTLHASSRTDAGVHALAMPVSFRIDSNLPLKAFVMGTNRFLNKDVQVMSAVEMPLDFHARFTAREKTYEYRIQLGPVAKPLERRFAWHVFGHLDLEAMTDAATRMVGLHDFSAFRSAQCDALSPVRTLKRVDVQAKGADLVTIEVESGGFLRNMVRIIAGTLVAVGQRKRPTAWIDELLESGDRTKGGQTAPPQGLFLKSVRYP